jgi:Tol biopolymer transport system component
MTRSVISPARLARCVTRGVLVAAVLLIGSAAYSVAAGAAASASDSPTGQLAYVRPATQADRGDAIYLANADGSSPRLLTRQMGRVGDLAWSPDGSTLALISGSGSSSKYDPPYKRLSVMDADGSGIRTLDVQIPAQAQSNPWFLCACAWSPDGSSLAVALRSDDDGVMGTNWILIVDVASGATRELVGPKDTAYGTLSWSPDGGRLLASAAVEETGWLETIDGPGGSETELMDPAGHGYMTWWSSGSYSPDGSRIACVKTTLTQNADDTYDNRSDVLLLTRDGRSAGSPLATGGTWGTPSWSPDGRWLAVDQGSVGSKARRLWLLPTGKGERRKLVEGALKPAWRPTVLAPLPGSPTQASCYGADYGEGQIDTTYSPGVAKRTLARAGFAADLCLNRSAQQALERLPQDSVFYFDGHGSWDGVYFADAKHRMSKLRTSSSWLPSADTSLGQTDLQKVDLAVFNACKCGKDIDAAGNILRRFVENGTQCAIGFNVSVSVDAGNRWGPAFFRYACDSGYEAGAAAMSAAEDSRESSLFCWADGIAADQVVVKRAAPTTAVYIYRSPPEVISTGY